MGGYDIPLLALAGSTSGALAKTMVSPLERIRLLCQTGESTGMINTMKLVMKMEGLKGFWRGNFTNCVRTIPSKGTLFMTNDVFKQWFTPRNSEGQATKLTPVRSAMAGSCAGMCAVSISYPLDVVRGRLAGRLARRAGGVPTRFTGLSSVIAITVQEEGFRALYRGVVPTLLGSIPYEGVKFCTYDMLCQFTKDRRANDDGIISGVLMKVMCGAVAGIAAGLTTYPNDTIRRRLQVQGAEGSAVMYRNYWHCLVTMLRTEGVPSFYSGLTPSLIRMVPNAALQFGFFEIFKHTLFPDDR